MRVLVLSLLVIFKIGGNVIAFENYEAKQDAAALQVDGFFGYPKEIDIISGDRPPFTRGYGFTFFPITTFAKHDLVGGVEFSLMPRQFYNQSTVLNGGFLQSYGIGLGYQILNSEKQEGFVFTMIGINGDMRDIGANNIYGDLIYTHQFTFSDRLRLGGGIDFHFYFGDFIPYPVLLLDWQIAKHTKLKINFDTGEIKQFLSNYLSVSLGAQYDIFHYGFGLQKGYLLESTSTMLRMEYRLGENIYARLSAKKPFWSEETVWPKRENALKNSGNSGVSLRIQVAYGE